MDVDLNPPYPILTFPLKGKESPSHSAINEGGRTKLEPESRGPGHGKKQQVINRI